MTFLRTILLAAAIWSGMPSAVAGTCKGADPCTACKDCSKCEFCTSGKGSCGVCRNQTTAERNAAARKKAKARR